MPIIIDYALDDSSIAASTIFKRIGFILQDEDHVRWTTDELIEWFNDAMVAMINANPAAGERDATLTLMEGARQELVDKISQLMSITCNIGADGMPGRAISRTDLSLMSLSAPEWQSGKKSSTVRQYMYEDRMPGVFYVYPPAVEGTKIRASMTAIPEPITSPDDPVPIRPEYADALVNYIAYRCLSKDSEFSNGQTAAAFYSAFQTAMGQEADGAANTSPNRNRA